MDPRLFRDSNRLSYNVRHQLLRVRDPLGNLVGSKFSPRGWMRPPPAQLISRLALEPAWCAPSPAVHLGQACPLAPVRRQAHAHTAPHCRDPACERANGPAAGSPRPWPWPWLLAILKTGYKKAFGRPGHFRRTATARANGRDTARAAAPCRRTIVTAAPPARCSPGQGATCGRPRSARARRGTQSAGWNSRNGNRRRAPPPVVLAAWCALRLTVAAAREREGARRKARGARDSVAQLLSEA